LRIRVALVRKAVECLDDTFTVWWAGCDPTEQDWPFSMVEQWLRQADPGLLKQAEHLGGWLGPSVSPMEVGANLVALLGVMQEMGPTVLVVDDIPWADDASIRVLGFVLRRLWADRVLVIATARTTSPHAAAAGAVTGDGEWRRLVTSPEHTRVLSLAGLPVEQTGELVRQYRVAGLGVGAVHRLWEHTGGHPLYLRSILADVPVHSIADTSTPLPVPATLASVVQRTLDRLPGPSRRLAAVLAVLDAQVPLAQAGQVADLDDPAVALGPLLQAGLVVWSPTDASSPVRIGHQLQREAVYRAIAPALRRDLHTAVVDVVDADSAWAHRVAAADRTDPTLADHLEAEAARLHQARQVQRAATLLLWAADLSPTRTLHEHRLLTATAHLTTVAFYDDARTRALQDRVTHCSPGVLRSCLLARYAEAAADYPAAVRLARQAVAEAEAETRAGADPALLARARDVLGRYAAHHGDFAEAAVYLRLAVDDPAAEPEVRDGARYMLVLAILNSDGPHAALQALEQMADLPEEPALADPTDTLLLLARGYARMIVDIRGARRDFETVLQRADATPMHLAHARAHLVLCLLRFGEYERVVGEAQRALTEAEVGGFPHLLALCHLLLAVLAAGQGRERAAAEHLDACRTRVPVSAFYRFVPELAGAWVAQARGDPAAAYEALKPMAATAHRTPVLRPWYCNFWLAWAEALTASGRLDQAEEAVARVQQLAHEADFRQITAAVTAGLAAARDDLQTARGIYRQALDNPAERNDPPLDRARLEWEAGRLELALGDRRAAARLLGQAHHAYAAAGLNPAATGVATDLAGCGVTSAASGSAPGTAELTDREQAVARLAAQGLTNQEIAHDLYVSPKTVEYHLGHVYAKLHLTSRRQLRTTLTPA
jgi:DNA-binding CsgD family transcriptional regulator